MISIVIVEYHSRPCLDRLMASLRRFEPNASVVISSNSLYHDGDARKLERDFPEARFIHNDRNLGYAKAVNKAFPLVTTPFVVVLNPDVEITEPIAEKVSAVFRRDPKLAIFSPRVLDGKGETARSFRRFYPPSYIIARYTGLNRFPKYRALQEYYLMSTAPPDRCAYVDWVAGGTIFVRMEAIHAVGGMDERYFLYMEDMDWCRQFWMSDWRVGYAPEFSLTHHARHEGTRRGILGVFSHATRLQIMSYLFYVRKWGMKRYRPSDHIVV